MLSILVATNKEGIIGLNGTLPWHLPQDLAHFKKMTMNHKVVFGRKTLEHMERVLKNRDVYCVTKQSSIVLKSGQPVTIINDFKDFCLRHQKTSETVYILGGAQIFASAMPYVDELIISFVDYEGPGDTRLNNFNLEHFRIVAREKHHDFEVITYRRNA